MKKHVTSISRFRTSSYFPRTPAERDSPLVACLLFSERKFYYETTFVQLLKNSEKQERTLNWCCWKSFVNGKLPSSNQVKDVIIRTTWNLSNARLPTKPIPIHLTKYSLVRTYTDWNTVSQSPFNSFIWHFLFHGKAKNLIGGKEI